MYEYGTKLKNRESAGKQSSTLALQLSLEREEDGVTAETENGATAGNEDRKSTESENETIEED